MKTAQIRRTLNDSKIGQRINGSYLGILVEGASREASDTLNVLGNYFGAGVVGAAALIVSGKRPLRGITLAGLSAFLCATAGMGRDLPVNAEDHYAHTSRLYREETDSSGRQVMSRISVKEALLTKLAERHLGLALGLASSSAPNGSYL